MCGVPIERSDEYLHRLIALGHRVAVCEQLEDPAEAQKARQQERGAPRRRAPRHARHADRGHAPRRPAQQLSAGDRAGARLLARRGRAASPSPSSTSRPASSASPNATASRLPAEIARARAGRDHRLRRALRRSRASRRCCASCRCTPLGRDVFDGATAERRLRRYFAVATTDAFGALSRLELTAAAACVTYVERTQVGKRPPLSPPMREAAGATLIDRCGDARQSRADAHARRRAARLAARRDRPHRHAPPARACWPSGSPRR